MSRTEGRMRLCAVLDNMRHMCHITGMHTITIRELHAATGKHVRASLHEPLIITERGKRIAVIKPFSEADVEGVPFPKRRADSLPAVGGDTTLLISEDRDGR